MKKWVFILVSLLFTISVLGCNDEAASKASKKALKKRIEKMEKSSGNPVSIEEIESSIEKYNDDINQIIMKTEKTGMWYKLLGTRYFDRKMYAKAYEAFSNALEIYPDNEILYYYLGTSAVYIANESISDVAKYDEYLSIAENAYLRSLQIDDRYAYSLYGIGVLYVYQMKKPEDAIPYLQKLLTIEKKNIDAKFVLSNAYYLTRQFDMAIETLESIIKDSKSDKIKDKAKENIQQIKDTYGTN